MRTRRKFNSIFLKMPKLTFIHPAVTFEVPKGATVLDAAMEHGVPLYHTCGGNASCSTCRVRVVSGESNLLPIDEAERRVLDAFDLGPGYRLGCQAMISGTQVTVEIPIRDKEPRPSKIPPLPGVE